jgi:hypothetical protein
MGHFAKLNENNVVIDVHSVSNFVFETNGIEDEQMGINFLTSIFDYPHWKQTSYNTHGGIYYENDGNTPSTDQSKAFRKNYAGIGYTYDEVRDAFIPPKPYPSWILNEFSCIFEAPIPRPNKDFILDFYKIYNTYKWNENNLNWDLIKPFESWVLNSDNYYISSIPYPNDGLKYIWDENLTNWIFLTNNG